MYAQFIEPPDRLLVSAIVIENDGKWKLNSEYKCMLNLKDSIFIFHHFQFSWDNLNENYVQLFCLNITS